MHCVELSLCNEDDDLISAIKTKMFAGTDVVFLKASVSMVFGLNSLLIYCGTLFGNRSSFNITTILTSF